MAGRLLDLLGGRWVTRPDQPRTVLDRLEAQPARGEEGDEVPVAPALMRVTAGAS